MKIKLTNEYWIRSGFFTLLKSVSAILLGFGSFFFLVRILDKNSFGVWCLFLGTTTLIEFSRNGLVSNSLIKYLSSSHTKDHSDIISASFGVTAILTLIGVCVNFGVGRWLSIVWHEPQVERLFYYYNIVFVLTGVINQFNCIQQANLEFKGSFLSSFAGSLISFVYIAASYYLKYPVSLTALILLQIFSSVVALVIAWWSVRGHLLVSFIIRKKWVSSMLGYGKYSFGTILSAMIFSSIDQWMLGLYVSVAAAGAYSIAARVANMVEVPTGAMATILFPQSARRLASEGKAGAKYLYEKSVGVIMSFLIPLSILLFIFSKQVVYFIASEKYAESVPLLRVAVLYCLLIPYGRQFGTILDSIGKPKLNFYIVITSAISNVGFNYYFIHRYGVIGAAYGTLCASILNFILCQIVLRKVLNIELLNTLRYAASFYPELFRKYLNFGRKKIDAAL